MAKNLRWKLLVIVGVVALAVFAFYPPDQKIRLGLDLKGGVHLVLRVQTDDALKLETQTTADRLAEQLKTAKIVGRRRHLDERDHLHRHGRVGPTRIGAFRNALTEVDVNYDRSQSGDTYTFTLKPNIVVQLREDTVNQALQTIERRVNELGVAEPVVARHSAADQILVQLPGVTDVNRAKEIIRSTAQLELKQVEQGPFSDENAAKAAYGNNLPPDMQLLPGTIEAAPGQPASTGYYVVRRIAGGDRPRPAHRAADARREQPSGGELLAQPGRRPQVRHLHAEQHRQAARHRARQPRAVGAGDPVADRRRGPHHRQLHQPGNAGPVAEAALGRAAGQPDLSRRARRSARRSAPIRFAPA